MTTPIDYATPSGMNWIRRHARRLMIVASLLAFVGVAYASRRPIDRYVRWQYGHWELSRWQMPSGPSMLLPDDPDDGGGTRDVSPPALLDLLAIDPRLRDRVNFSFGLSTFPSRFAYVGQRRRPDGRWRTVILTQLGHFAGMTFEATKVVVVARPGPFSLPPTGSGPFTGRGWTSEGFVFPQNVFVSEDPNDAAAIVVETEPLPGFDGPEGRTRYVARLANDDGLDWSIDGTPRPRADGWLPQPEP